MSASPEQYKQIIVDVIDGVYVVKFVQNKMVSDYPVEKMGDELYSLIEVQGVKKILIDFTNMNYMCSSALSRFVVLQDKANQNNCIVKMANLPPMLHQIFFATRLNTLMKIYKTSEEALAAFLM